MQGPRAERVGTTLKGRFACAPAHLDAEVLSALFGGIRGGHLDVGRGRLAARRLARLELHREPLDVLLDGAWRHRHNLCAYDALYVALATALRCPLVTLDARLTRAPELGVAVVVIA